MVHTVDKAASECGSSRSPTSGEPYRVPAPSEAEWVLTRAVLRAAMEQPRLGAPEGTAVVPHLALAEVLMDLESYRDDAARLHRDKMDLWERLNFPADGAHDAPSTDASKSPGTPNNTLNTKGKD